MLIIFDFDGVIRSFSWTGLINAYTALITYLDKNPNDFFNGKNEFKKWFSPDWQINMQNVQPGFIPSETTNKIFHEKYDSHTHIFSWAKTNLEFLSKKHTLTLLSSSSKNSVIKDLNNLDNFFSMIMGHEQVGQQIKPNPKGINIIRKKFNEKKNNSLIIGDDEVDIIAGKNAGISTGAVRWGIAEKEPGKWEKIIALKPDYLFEKPNDLLKTLV